MIIAVPCLTHTFRSSPAERRRNQETSSPSESLRFICRIVGETRHAEFTFWGGRLHPRVSLRNRTGAQPFPLVLVSLCSRGFVVLVTGTKNVFGGRLFESLACFRSFLTRPHGRKRSEQCVTRRGRACPCGYRGIEWEGRMTHRRVPKSRTWSWEENLLIFMIGLLHHE